MQEGRKSPIHEVCRASYTNVIKIVIPCFEKDKLNNPGDESVYNYIRDRMSPVTESSGHKYSNFIVVLLL